MMMKDAELNYRDIFYPPGGILIWMIIFVELITFSLGLIAMIYLGNTEPSVFHSSCLTLNKNIAIINTIVLLTSSYFMAMAIQFVKNENTKKALNYIGFTILFGLLFVILKSIDYYLKIQAGEFLTTNTFYTFYWILTAFHLIHVLIGLSILIYFYLTLRKTKSDLELTDLMAGATFWHMCDLIWLLLFPVLYLIF
jgi:nitric oxide reductase NorE protein